MKKYIYSLIATCLVLTGCAKFDEEVQIAYPAGPEVEITLNATTDDDFTVTITPADGTMYYAYLVDQAEEVDPELEAEALFKAQYKGAESVEYDGEPLTMTVEAEPNTTYVVYAIAGNEKGVLGNVATLIVKTTDAGVPVYYDFVSSGDQKIAALVFTEDVLLGTGAVHASYLSEWEEDENGGFVYHPVLCDVEVEDGVPYISVPLAPAGSYVFINWEAGAFTDMAGNPCGAFNNSGITADGKLAGVYFHVTNKPWALTAANVVAAGEDLQLATSVQLTFTQPTFINNYKKGNFTLTYTGAAKSVIYEIAADDFTYDGTTLTVNFPETPTAGDKLTLTIGEGALNDINGNPNNKFTTPAWTYVESAYELYYGTYSYTDTYGDEGTLEIIATGEENKFIINGLLGNSAPEGQTEGYYDPDTKTLHVACMYTCGVINYQGTDYMSLIYNGAQEATFTVDPVTGVFTSDNFNIVLANMEVTELIGYWCKAPAVWAPLTEAQASKAKARRSFKADWSIKGTPVKNVKK